MEYNKLLDYTKIEIKNSLLASGFDLKKAYLGSAIDAILGLVEKGRNIKSDINALSFNIDVSYVPEDLQQDYAKGLLTLNDPIKINMFRELLFGNITEQDINEFKQSVVNKNTQ